MKYLSKLSILIIVLIFTLLPRSGFAQENITSTEEPYAGSVLCQPGSFMIYQDYCLPFGPSEVLTEMAVKGITLPLRPSPASKPSPSLNDLKINYAKINLEAHEPAKIFPSIDAAVEGSNSSRNIAGGELRYVTYNALTVVNGGNYVQIDGGEWMRASPIAGYTTFQGLEFSRTPDNNFGWIVADTRPRFSPSYQASERDEVLTRETVVQIYDIVDADNTQWFMIGLNQWVERLMIRQVAINTEPPEGVIGSRWIEINLYEQTLAVYEENEILFATMIATGVEPYYTQPGVFQIYDKRETDTMSGAFEADRSDYYFLQDVPWTMYFDKARAIHGAYWRAWFGYPQTHGCVNLSVGDSHWVFDWASVGDYVYVWDPTGLTPTDPALYTEGGA